MTATELLLAQELQETKEIKVIKPDWNNLIDKIIAIDLDIKWWRGETRLRKEDLGLEESDPEYQEFLQKQVRFGTKRIIPERFFWELRLLEGRARQLMITNAQHTPWGFLMSKKVYPAWREKMVEVQTKFLEVGEQLAFERDQVVEEMRELYQRAAQGAWEIRQKKEQSNGDEISKAPNYFIEGFVETILSQIPSVKEIQNSFYFDWTPSYIAPPKEVLLEKQLEEAFKVTEEDKEKWEAFKEEEALEKEIREKSQKRWSEQVETTLSEVSAGVRELIHDTILDALAGLKRNTYLHSRSLVALRNLITRSRALNFLDDPGIESKLVEIQCLVAAVTRDTDPTEVQKVLDEIKNETRLELLSLGRLPRGGRKLDIAETLESNETRKGRTNLDKEDVPELSANKFRRGKREEATAS